MSSEWRAGHGGPGRKYFTITATGREVLRDVPGRAIGQIVAEVESHVRETGEDPIEAFGQPGSYSAQFASRRRPVGRGGWLTLDDVTFTMFMVGALVLLNGVLNLGEIVNVTANIVSWAARLSYMPW